MWTILRVRQRRPGDASKAHRNLSLSFYDTVGYTHAFCCIIPSYIESIYHSVHHPRLFTGESFFCESSSVNRGSGDGHCWLLILGLENGHVNLRGRDLCGVSGSKHTASLNDLCTCLLKMSNH